MTIIEKIQQLFGDDLDEERLKAVVRTCGEMLTSFMIDLELREKDQKKLKVVQSRLKEVKEKIKETGMKARYAVDLYNQHLDIEFKKMDNNLPFNISVIPDTTSIFKAEIFRWPGFGDEFPVMDHVECALINAQKACEESIVWTIFFSALEDLREDLRERLEVVPKKLLLQNTSKELSMKEENNSYTRDCHRIFTNQKGRQLFEYLHANLVSQKNPLADFTFIFRRMQRDGYIYEDIKEKPFRDFLSRHFEIEINYKLKPDGYNVTDLKEKMYSNAVSSLN